MWFSSEGLRDEFIRNLQRQPAHLATLAQLRQLSQPETPILHPRPEPDKMVQDLVNEHTLRSQRYYGNQELRPDVPVSPQPTAEDIARRSRCSGIRSHRCDELIRKDPEMGRSTVTDMEDITSDLKQPLTVQRSQADHAQRPWDKPDKPDFSHSNRRSHEGVIGTNWTRDGSAHEEQRLSEDFEIVEYDDDLIADFEEVDRDLPAAFNGPPPR